MRIDLVPDAMLLRYPPLRVGGKTRELDRAEIDKQQNAGVLEPDMSEWEAWVLFVPKKDGKICFCND